NRFNDVFQILSDTNLFIRLRFRGHFEDIRKHIVLRVVVDDFDTTFFVVAQRAKYSAIFTHKNLLTKRLLVRIADDLTLKSKVRGFQKRYPNEQDSDLSCTALQAPSRR